jgi:16S rRNA (cytidine1402-2'-O)-methyltransferase
VLVIGPPEEHAGAVALDEVDAKLQQALVCMAPAAAAAEVAAATGLGRREVYRRALALKEGGAGQEPDQG